MEIKNGHGGYVGEDDIPRLNVLDLQRLIRVIPKPVIAIEAMQLVEEMYLMLFVI